jgi:hypothetical protein
VTSGANMILPRNSEAYLNVVFLFDSYGYSLVAFLVGVVIDITHQWSALSMSTSPGSVDFQEYLRVFESTF